MSTKGRLTKEEVKARTLAAIVCFVAGVLITIGKFWAQNMTNSQGVYSDALESIVNVLTAVLGLFVVYYSSRPVDTDHPYGHGKVEYFSSAFEGGLIFFAAFFIFVEASKALIDGPQLKNLDAGALILFGAGIANMFLGLFLRRVGKKHNSPALLASGAHVLSDFWTSAAVIASLLVIHFTNWIWLDIVIAFSAGGYLAWTGIKLVRQSISGLMDEEDLSLLRDLAAIFEKHVGDGIIQIHHTKIIRSGWFHHIDAHVVVPEFWKVEEAHDHLKKFEESFVKDYQFDAEANFHVDPCQRKYCSVCDYPDCPVRREAFVKRMRVRLADLRSPEEPEEFAQKFQQE